MSRSWGRMGSWGRIIESKKAPARKGQGAKLGTGLTVLNPFGDGERGKRKGPADGEKEEG